ncbi:MAG TPA: glycosyltransferase family 4 protein [Solirubrobacterales bacterium]
MNAPRLVGLAQDDPSTPTIGSGAAAKFLFDALGRRYSLVGRGGVELSKVQRYAIAGATFHPRRQRWRSRFNWHRALALKARSRNSARVLAQIGEPCDLVVQVFGLFQTRGCPYVLYIDNTVELSHLHWPGWVDVGSRDLQRIFAWERHLYGDALHIFTMGSPAAESIASFYEVPRERISVVGGGTNFRPKLSPREREPVVLFVGRDWSRKGGDRLIEAFRRVREQMPEARLTIVGTEDAPRDEPGVDVLGVVRGRERMAALYESARVFCLPSRFEPYGLAIAEAMAYGLPCIATRVGAFDEIVMEEETGLIVPPDDTEALGDAMIRLLSNPTLADQMGTAARRRVEIHQSWDATVERMSPDLERVCAELRG